MQAGDIGRSAAWLMRTHACSLVFSIPGLLQLAMLSSRFLLEDSNMLASCCVHDVHRQELEQAFHGRSFRFSVMVHCDEALPSLEHLAASAVLQVC